MKRRRPNCWLCGGKVRRRLRPDLDDERDRIPHSESQSSNPLINGPSSRSHAPELRIASLEMGWIDKVRAGVFKEALFLGRQIFGRAPVSSQLCGKSRISSKDVHPNGLREPICQRRVVAEPVFFAMRQRNRTMIAGPYFHSLATRLGRLFITEAAYGMTEAITVRNASKNRDPRASDQLLPLVYDELRSLARQRLAAENPGQTLQATALVHEAYLRLVGDQKDQRWDNRGHFFAAAAEAMRRILIDQARRKKTAKRGGDLKRIAPSDDLSFLQATPDEMIALDEALGELIENDPIGGEIVKLRYFAGLTVEQAADSLGISNATAYRHWAFARAWLHRELSRTR